MISRHTQFSTRLAALAVDNDPDVFLHADIRVDGPYGELAVAHWRTDYAHLVLCGGGSGVTPMMSMLGELLHMRANKQMAHVQVTRVHCVMLCPVSCVQCAVCCVLCAVCYVLCAVCCAAVCLHGDITP